MHNVMHADKLAFLHVRTQKGRACDGPASRSALFTADTVGALILLGGSLIRVEDVTSCGRRLVVEAERVPEGMAGPVRFLVGRWERRPSFAPTVNPAEDLVALATAVGVLD